MRPASGQRRHGMKARVFSVRRGKDENAVRIKVQTHSLRVVQRRERYTPDR